MMRKVLQFGLPMIVLLIGFYGSWWLVVNRKAVESVPKERFKPQVKTVSVKFEDFQVEVHSQGTVMPRREVVLSTEVSGRVVWISSNLVTGGVFFEGDELLRVDRGDYELALRQAIADIQSAQAGMTNALAQVCSSEAQIAQVQARITREEAEAEAARAEWKLLGREGEPPALLVRTPQLREVRAALASAEASVRASQAKHNSGKAALAAAEAARDQAQVNLERCILHAPFDGRVKSQSIGIGQLVSRATILATIQPVSVAEVRLPLTMVDLNQVGLSGAMHGGIVEGPKVRLSAGEEEWLGAIVRVEGEVDSRTRMLALVANVPEPYSENKTALNFGRFVKARIEGRLLSDVIVLPRVSYREGGVVYLEREGKLFSKKVNLAWSDRKRVVITGELSEGEMICLSALDSFVEGMEVRVGE